MSDVVTPATRRDGGFDAALTAVRDVEGWMTDAQALRLWNRAATVPAGGRIVEIGSFRGRSAIVLARAAADDVEVVAIDPHAGNDRGPQQIAGTAEEGQSDNEAFLANLERGGVRERVRHVRRPSQEAFGEVGEPIDLLYVDGAHRYAPARDDIARWGDRVRPGGTLLIHDSFSSVGVTLAIGRLLVGSARWRYVGRDTSLAEYRREPLSGGARARDAGRQVAQLPWFARNVAIKVAIVAGRPGVARRLGHRDGPWPY